MDQKTLSEAKVIEAKLDNMFPEKNLLNSTDIQRYTGLSWSAVKRMFGLKRGHYIDKTVLSIRLASIIEEANRGNDFEN